MHSGGEIRWSDRPIPCLDLLRTSCGAENCLAELWGIDVLSEPQLPVIEERGEGLLYSFETSVGNDPAFLNLSYKLKLTILLGKAALEALSGHPIL